MTEFLHKGRATKQLLALWYEFPQYTSSETPVQDLLNPSAENGAVEEARIRTEFADRIRLVLPRFLQAHTKHLVQVCTDDIVQIMERECKRLRDGSVCTIDYNSVLNTLLQNPKISFQYKLRVLRKVFSLSTAESALMLCESCDHSVLKSLVTIFKSIAPPYQQQFVIFFLDVLRDIKPGVVNLASSSPTFRESNPIGRFNTRTPMIREGRYTIRFRVDAGELFTVQGQPMVVFKTKATESTYELELHDFQAKCEGYELNSVYKVWKKMLLESLYFILEVYIGRGELSRTHPVFQAVLHFLGDLTADENRKRLTTEYSLCNTLYTETVEALSLIEPAQTYPAGIAACAILAREILDCAYDMDPFLELWSKWKAAVQGDEAARHVLAGVESGLTAVRGSELLFTGHDLLHRIRKQMARFIKEVAQYEKLALKQYTDFW
jgi:hypothetical protein